jgi:hypothetical protein
MWAYSFLLYPLQASTLKKDYKHIILNSQYHTALSRQAIPCASTQPFYLNSAAVYTFHPKIILASTLKMLNIIIKNNHSVDNTQQIAFSISSKIKKEKQVKSAHRQVSRSSPTGFTKTISTL